MLTLMPSYPSMLAAGGLESVLTLVVIVILSALNSWFAKRKADREAREAGFPQTEEPSPYAPPPQAPTSPTNWEEELRRLLQGEPQQAPPATPPPLQTQPPPVPVHREIAPQPAWSRNAPPQESRPVYEDEGPAMDLPPPTRSWGRASELQESVVERLRQVSAGISHHQEAESALAYADQYQARIAAQSQNAFLNATQAAPRPIRALKPEVAQLVASLKNPVTARSAVLASLILAPPKALE